MKRPALTSCPFGLVVSCCISPPFGRLSTTRGQITYVLLTRAPLYRGRSPFSCDLHVLSAPRTFVLSQDQTLQMNFGGGLASPRLCIVCLLPRNRVRLSPFGPDTKARLRITLTYDSVFKDRGGV
jgi:hypothetical protein